MDEVIKAKRQQNAGSGTRAITIRGAREHNLKNIDLEIPRDRLVVFTGLSGSGKSSLAFDTIYAEGQRRYVESLSAYARQFLEMMQKPDVDQIDGLSPAISIEQKTTSKNPRSTVGTVTEIYDYMRLLWARVGVPYSPATGLPIESQIVSQMVDRVLALPEGTRLYLLAPVVRGRKGEYRKELAEYLKRGFQRVKIDGSFYELAEAPLLDKKFPHDIDVVVDRIVVRSDIGQRLAESFETALKLAEGLAVIEYADGPAPQPSSFETRPAGAPQDEDGARRSKAARRSPSPYPEEAQSAVSKDEVATKKVAKIHDKSGPEPGVRLHHSGDRAPAVLLQQPLWRLPGLRRPRHRAAYRRGPGHPRQGTEPAQGRDRAMGEVVLALLRPDPQRARQILQVRPRHQMEGPSEENPKRHPAWLRRG
jgi:excinuclease ABC subunit A